MQLNYGVMRKIRLFNLPIRYQFDLFDKVVLPVLIYGYEIWGYEYLQVCERIHFKFSVKRSTPSFIVYGETGCFPIYVNVYCTMISRWAKLLWGCDNNIVYVSYKILFIWNPIDTVKNPWLECIHRILNMCGLSNIWQQQQNVN